MAALKWIEGDLPGRPGEGRPSELRNLIPKLKDRPGVWALLTEHPHGSKRQYWQRQYGEEYQFVTRTVLKRGKKTRALFGRYIGGQNGENDENAEHNEGDSA